MKKLILFSLLLTGLTTAALADQPYVSEKPATVQSGTLQIELGTTYTRGGQNKSLAGEVTLSAGLSDNVDVQVGTSYTGLNLGRGSGLNDGSVAVKVRLNPHFAVQAGTTLPFGSKNLSSNSYDPFAKIIVGTTLTKSLYAFANVGYQYNRQNGAKNSILGSLALEQTLDPNSKVFAEIYGQTNNSFNNNQGAFAVGLIHRINKNLQFDVKVGRNFRNVGEPNFFGGVGITLNR